MSFGFSVGDFFAALKLVGAVIDGLRESSYSSATFRSLINELYSLETALLRVKRLDLNDAQPIDKIALRQAASQCQQTIDVFYKKLQNDQPYLQHGLSNCRIKSAWSKVKWAVCKKDDLETFRAEIRGHTSSIEILLLTTQMEATTVLGRTQDAHHRRLVNLVQDFSCQAMGALSSISTSVAQSVQQGKTLLESSVQIVQTNLRIFQLVQDIHRFITKMPAQILREQPVYMVDVFNRQSPFYLEFIRSPEAFLAVVKANLKETGCGPMMIDRGEFTIEELGTQMSIDLSQPWETCFTPGQKVGMSMVFEQDLTKSTTSCPRCQAEQINNEDLETSCTICGTIFRRVEEVIENPEIASSTLDAVPSLDEQQRAEPAEGSVHRPKKPLKRKFEGEDISNDLRKFRRIRMVNPQLSAHQALAKCRCMYRGDRLRHEPHLFQGGFCLVYMLKDRPWFKVQLAFSPYTVVVNERISSGRKMDFKPVDDYTIIWQSADGMSNELRFYESSTYEWVRAWIVAWQKILSGATGQNEHSSLVQNDPMLDMIVNGQNFPLMDVVANRPNSIEELLKDHLRQKDRELEAIRNQNAYLRAENVILRSSRPWKGGKELLKAPIT